MGGGYSTYVGFDSVFKYVKLILLKEKYILGRIGLYFVGFGE